MFIGVSAFPSFLEGISSMLFKYPGTSSISIQLRPKDGSLKKKRKGEYFFSFLKIIKKKLTIPPLPSVVAQTWPCPKSTHRPKLLGHSNNALRLYQRWSPNLGRWVGLGHGLIWTTYTTEKMIKISNPLN